MRETPPPESRLLQLIRNGGQTARRAPAWKTVPASAALKFRDALEEWMEQPWVLARNLFALGTALAVGVILWDAARPMDRGLHRLEERAGGPPAETAPAPKAASLDRYLSVILRKDLFRSVAPQPQAVKAAAKPSAPPPPPPPTLRELAADLSLVGVIDAGEPQAVILDKKSQKTHYLTTGQTLGPIHIGKIGENRVTLELDQQTFDLSM